MPSIPADLLVLVVERAHRRCEYCQTQQDIVVDMTIDHILPRAAGGDNNADNLCLCCAGCNSRKQDHVTGVDPETATEFPLFNPRTQIWYDHFRWSKDGVEVIGLTPVGRSTIARLKLNRPQLLISRRGWVSVGWHPPTD